MAMFRKRARARQINHLSEIDDLMEGDQPILIDFWQVGCGPCKVMDGIVNELAEEYAGTAQVVKVDVARVPSAVQAFAVRSTPTFVVLGRSAKTSKKKRAKGAPAGKAKMTPRWRASGLVQKDQLERVLESNGAKRAG